MNIRFANRMFTGEQTVFGGFSQRTLFLNFKAKKTIWYGWTEDVAIQFLKQNYYEFSFSIAQKRLVQKSCI